MSKIDIGDKVVVVTEKIKRNGRESAIGKIFTKLETCPLSHELNPCFVTKEGLHLWESECKKIMKDDIIETLDGGFCAINGVKIQIGK